MKCRGLINLLFVSLAGMTPAMSTASIEESIKVYSESLMNAFTCDVESVCFDKLVYRSKHNDFMLYLVTNFSGEYEPKKLKNKINMYDQPIRLLHEKLIYPRGMTDGSIASVLLTSDDESVDQMIRGNLNIIYQLQYIDASIMILSSKNGIRSYKGNITSKEELDKAVSFLLQSDMN